MTDTRISVAEPIYRDMLREASSPVTEDNLYSSLGDYLINFGGVDQSLVSIYPIVSISKDASYKDLTKRYGSPVWNLGEEANPEWPARIAIGSSRFAVLPAEDYDLILNQGDYMLGYYDALNGKCIPRHSTLYTPLYRSGWLDARMDRRLENLVKYYEYDHKTA